MALIGKREDLVHVPWSSVEEWLLVYKQIYSGNSVEQRKACDALLVWKARIPKLPVGVECTLGLIQVCLRDQEWMPKINNNEMPISYENDLQMMYSTVIMKFLNHISNIAHNKHTSLFVIAKQLNIPDWIVNLRHDIAHGYELPSIDVMRIVANILLTWLHEEYWSAEAKTLQESQEIESSECLDSEDEENLIDLIELWTTIGLYVKTDHALVSDLPDNELRTNLDGLLKKLKVTAQTASDPGTSSLRTLADDTELTAILNLLLAEISKNLNKGDSLLRREKLVVDCILSNEAFLVDAETLGIFVDGTSCSGKKSLPKSLLSFWKDFLLLLHERRILLSLFVQLIETIKAEADGNKRLIASLWAKAIAQAFRKQKISRQVYQNLEQQFDHENRSLSIKSFLKIVRNEVEASYPNLKNALDLKIFGEFPNCLLNETFIKGLILNFTDYSENFIPEIFELSSFLDCDTGARSQLLKLMRIHSLRASESAEEAVGEVTERVYTVENLKELVGRDGRTPVDEQPALKNDYSDRSIRNTSWQIASDECDWSSCPIGILPWQIDDVQATEPITVSASSIRYAIVNNTEFPGIVDSKNLQLHSKIQWESILSRKKKTKRKTKSTSEKTSAAIINRAMQSVKSFKAK